MKYHIEVHGCQMNTSDAERIATVCERNGYFPSNDISASDLIIYVSCSIKQKAEDKIIGHMREISRLKKNNPDLQIAITGCMVRKTSTRKDSDMDKILRTLPTVDFVFRMEDLDQVDHILREKTPNDVGKNFGDTTYLKIKPKLGTSFRGYLPIMSGCDNFCTFCVVPYTRGREQSRFISEVLDDAKQMASNGVKEILLLGQNVNSFGNKTNVYDERICNDKSNHPFTRLLMELNKIEGISRIRYTSPNPKDITEELIKAMSELNKVCEHIHIPLQSGDDEMLKRMNRHYTAEHFLNLIKLIRKYMPRAGITTDIIVGFSGETEEQFQNTIRVCKQARFDLSYTSMYSERKETYAGRFLKDKIPKKEKNLRYHIVNDLVRQTSFENNKNYIGETWEVLVDKIKNNIAMGKTRTNRTVRFTSTASIKPGIMCDIKVVNALEWVLEGELAQTLSSHPPFEALAKKEP